MNGVSVTSVRRCVHWQERAGQQAALAQHLKPVADADDETVRLGKAHDVLHDGREARDGSGPQVIAVREAAGDDHHVYVAEVGFFVPDELRLLPEDVLGHVVGVVVAVGAGEDDDAEADAHRLPGI